MAYKLDLFLGIVFENESSSVTFGSFLSKPPPSKFSDLAPVTPPPPPKVERTALKNLDMKTLRRTLNTWLSLFQSPSGVKCSKKNWSCITAKDNYHATIAILDSTDQRQAYEFRLFHIAGQYTTNPNLPSDNVLRRCAEFFNGQSQSSHVQLKCTLSHSNDSLQYSTSSSSSEVTPSRDFGNLFDIESTDLSFGLLNASRSTYPFDLRTTDAFFDGLGGETDAVNAAEIVDLLDTAGMCVGTKEDVWNSDIDLGLMSGESSNSDTSVSTNAISISANDPPTASSQSPPFHSYPDVISAAFPISPSQGDASDYHSHVDDLYRSWRLPSFGAAPDHNH
ncbi:uncharacterized protein EV420DRAFT_1752770 [Desarmillaria tabescens]|uniref:Uncharacterized protein n=1 Tax=Armillaria tabescens TaxID=1929756 RepID=A0AA39MMA3_ARMTA|nr:uncharacterized protein EV420DRAFT_1752770 [Desarmillaria tabescens]KAK0440026.1 hypothetical protein EV420DRAFT_1752770 [Desarmillaria tabescens]